MGSLCSPDRIDPAVEPDTAPSKRNQSKNNKNNNNKTNGYLEDESTASYTNTNGHDLSQTNGVNPDMVDDLEFSNPSNTENESPPQPNTINEQYSLSQPTVENIHSNTSRTGLKQIQNEMGLDDQNNQIQKEKNNKKGFQIVVTPADDNNTENVSYEDTQSQDEEDQDLMKEKKYKKIDSTLGGQIVWKKVADFSGLLPRDVKLKLWNGVFKEKNDYNLPEIKRISKVLRTFVMLQLTREYKKTNETVPNELKQQLPGAVKEPSKFIAAFFEERRKVH